MFFRCENGGYFFHLLFEEKTNVFIAQARGVSRQSTQGLISDDTHSDTVISVRAARGAGGPAARARRARGRAAVPGPGASGCGLHTGNAAPIPRGVERTSLSIRPLLAKS
jgi:hypothetical protein